MTKKELVKALKEVKDDTEVMIVTPPLGSMTSNVFQIKEINKESREDVVFLHIQ